MLNDDVSKHLSPSVRTAGSLAPQLHCEDLDRCSPGPRRRKITGAGTILRLAARSLFWSSCGVERYDLSEIFPQTGSLARQHRRCGLDRRSPDLRRWKVTEALQNDDPITQASGLGWRHEVFKLGGISWRRERNDEQQGEETHMNSKGSITLNDNA